MKDTSSTKTTVEVVLLIIALIGCIWFSVARNFNDTTYTITITDKERVTSSSSKQIISKYIIFGDDEDGNSLVFENSDTWLRGKWDSSNLQGKLKEGKTYEITVVGYRIPFLSMYQNILKAEEIKESA